MNILQKIKRKILLYTFGGIEKYCYSWGIFSAQSLCLPDFLVIGAQKAGTTWLDKNLRCHPELFLPEIKELHYFDTYFHYSLKYYSNFFKPGHNKIKGEVCPAYGILPKRRIHFIWRNMPDTKLIFIMRNPIYRAWSHAMMDLVVIQGRKLEDISDHEFKTFLKTNAALKRGDYLNILNNWLSIFPQKQIYIGFFDDISKHPEKFLLGIFSFLGVSTNVKWDAYPLRKIIKPVHDLQSRSDSSIRPTIKSFLEQMYSSEMKELHSRFGSPVENWTSVIS